MSTEQSKRKILLIDNNQTTCIYFRDIFWIHGHNDVYEIDMASSLNQAEEKITNKDSRPDMIFLDILIPIDGEKNGVDDQIQRSLAFVEKIKNDTELTGLKIVIYSTQKDESIKEKFSRLGVDGYLMKDEMMPKEVIAFVNKMYESNN